jgi:hypothetical protein
MTALVEDVAQPVHYGLKDRNNRLQMLPIMAIAETGGNNTLYRFCETPLGSCGVRPSAGELLAVLRNG